MPAFSKADAKRRLDREISEAQTRYERTIRALEAKEVSKLVKKHLYDQRGLSSRASGAVRHNFDNDPKKVAAEGIAALMGMPNLGNKSIQEIVAWVEAEGFTMNPKRGVAFYREQVRKQKEEQLALWKASWNKPIQPGDPWEYRGPARTL